MPVVVEELATTEAVVVVEVVELIAVVRMVKSTVGAEGLVAMEEDAVLVVETRI